MKYKIIAETSQIIEKTIHLEIEAESPADAEEKSLEALYHYPKPVPGTDVVRIQTIKAEGASPPRINIAKIRVKNEKY